MEQDSGPPPSKKTKAAKIELLPQKRNWEQGENERAIQEWAVLLEKVTAGGAGCELGGVSEEKVSFKAEILSRREMGKQLVFLTLCRLGKHLTESSGEESTLDQ
eukprot:CAMPEP_0177738626 /NCGR_PEP_ID=MMETSP0484_2-20121128/26557_1 /TAXON_ID=354590 /ORGANISM="Rhodomonas lens, Strain RHODO" /LENGTH=103 /DNA_ID=CAMNT_0019252563 /DNA_START=14 /DNA_END=322 /DNA_ORIENTATION=+